MNFRDCVKNKKCYFYRFFWVFFPRCYYESLKNESILDFQCHAQISFSRFRDQRHIVLKPFFFLELPKNRKKIAFIFLICHFCSICVSIPRDRGRGGCLHCAENKAEAILYKCSIWNNQVGSLPFSSLWNPLGDGISCLSCSTTCPQPCWLTEKYKYIILNEGIYFLLKF